MDTIASPRELIQQENESELLVSQQPHATLHCGRVGLVLLSLIAVATAGSVGWKMLAANPAQGSFATPGDLSKEDQSVFMRDDDPSESKKPSLFERLGGAYPVSTVVDRFIDTIMVDPDLNKNPRVQKAHHRVKPAGFKYLVWEVVCFATGGPCKYTGRSMKEAHWHLKITNDEWDAFARDFGTVLNFYKVPKDLQDEVFEVLGKTKEDIVNEDSADVKDPPAADADADPKTIYGKLGGIYPIATVVDKFIDTIMLDAVLNDNEKVNEAHHKVAPPGFKNLVAQFAAAGFGGPQKYIGKDMQKAHAGLDITPGEWKRFAGLFGSTLDTFDVPEELKGKIFEVLGPLEAAVICNGDNASRDDSCKTK